MRSTVTSASKACHRMAFARFVEGRWRRTAPSSLMREVIGARRIADGLGRFIVRTLDGEEFSARKLSLATGTRDQLPDVKDIDGFYGTSVHHCPYCDGWEHRGRRLMALGAGSDAVARPCFSGPGRNQSRLVRTVSRFRRRIKPSYRGTIFAS